jgi:carbonic anhydrase/acetyltransferase-like protein (isoleucine patch superfamily)
MLPSERNLFQGRLSTYDDSRQRGHDLWGENIMPIYELDGIAPELPAEDHYWVAPDANLIGKVTLHEDAGIWFGCTLRGDNERITVGKRSNIQESSLLHTDMGSPLTIGADCTIGHHVILHGCTIADNCLIGMGAIVMNGAKIGRNSIVGAGALVTEGKEFPENSLIVGSPAKVVRQLDEVAATRIGKSAAGYVTNWKRFARGLKPVG